MRAGEASTTARRVAAQRLTFPRVPADFGRPDDDDRLQADVAAGTAGGTTMMTGYLRARTAYFDGQVVDAIGRGIDQLVLVGAGYDGRSLRYAKSGVRWFELDHPDTQADKLERLDRLGIDRTAIGFASADFGVDDAGTALAGAGHDRTRPSVFLCEGVAAYLPIDVLTRLLSTLAGGAAPGSRLVATMPTKPRSLAGRARRAALRTAVAGFGEPLVTTIPLADLRPLFDSTGWTVVSAVDPRGAPIEQSPSGSAFVVAQPK